MKNYSDKAAMVEAMKSLRRYIRSMYISVELPELDEKALEEYFDSDNKTVCAAFEKAMGLAAAKVIYADKDIPNSTKKKTAETVSTQFIQAFQGAKIEYEYASGKYGSHGQKAAATYEEKKKKVYICQKAAFLDRLKKNLPRYATKFAAKEGVKMGLAAVGAGVGGPLGAVVGFAVGMAVDMAWYCTPKKIKDKVKATAQDLADKACRVIESVGQEIKKSEVVQQAAKVVKKYVEPVVKPICDAVKNGVEKVGNLAQKGLKKFKSLFA